MATRLMRSGLTYEDYLKLPDDGQRYEIIDGELYVSPAPNIKHQRVSARLAYLLTGHVLPRRMGDVFSAPTDVRLQDPSTVQPDILYVSRARRGIIGAQSVEGPPDLVVEIISPSSTQMDLEIKRDLYARHGVPYYWVAHPHEEWLRAYALGPDGQYELVAEAHGNVTFSAAPFPDLTIPLATIWEE